MTRNQNSTQKRQLTEAALTASAIKTELSGAFPGVKFSVTSDNFAGGDAVRIKWNDGPTVSQVEAHSGKFQYGRFNGMEDIYEYSNEREDIPQVKYVSESRSMSDAVKKSLTPSCEQVFTGDAFGCRDLDSFIRQLFWHYPIPLGAEILGIESTGATSGPASSPEHFYRIRMTLPQTLPGAEKPAAINVTPGKIQVLEYGEKAIAVVGETKPIKDKLKKLGGRFNPKLTCGPGWIFPRNKLDLLRTSLTAAV